ncbi:MAG: ATP-binding protein [Candidatus Micrarchaeota archaeon]|nr:ATP-binding protein [Candidatus Micrarchaeota archaeon]
MTINESIIVEMNPWWKGRFVVEYKEREIYPTLKKYMNTKQIIGLTGLRRVGKTTLMLKLAMDEIESGKIDPLNVLYFSFDDMRNGNITEMINLYESMTEKNIRKGKFLFLFDEIQKLEGWENQLKTVYDLYKNNVKIIISGSESLFIRKKTKESLAGRIFEFRIKRLSFPEFLKFKDFAPKHKTIYRKELSSMFRKYIKTYGFPELIDVEDREIITKYIKEGITEKIIYKDIPSFFSVRDPTILESLLSIFMEEPGQITDFIELSKELGISRQTVSQYVRYLEDSFLLKKLYNYSRSRRKAERKLKKYYPEIISPRLVFSDDALSKSKVLEYLVVIESDAEFFWRDAYKNEVDMIINGKKPIPVEIKYGKIETRGLLAFMKKFSIKTGFIVTAEKEDIIRTENMEINIIPVWKFLTER